MGLPRAGATGLDKIEKRFSDNALKVVGAQHLNAYREMDPTIYQTKKDLEIIRKLIRDYISDPRTIIL
ncbi:hypothetical protein HRR81_006925 [Exophiala dermatitidis]|nr:hypothetical protein HRR74_006168 [Exophiala dermatitidis]KAJ4568013.1 hypothetical protein HRR81_006925 [Exophiala dermatitidis]KAJ4624824.1 hypothetical protein HRR86_005245 [Exophiala dermatitidis]KAJ4633281.1 hypothetical protein HRR89_008038 [Exophiala dermatitidis]KAJ4647494.1 hypothetical protein HRR91_006309 [Exophiala dermatitidis]